MKQEFDLEYQYKLYLYRMGLSEETMHPVQKKQLRQTFMGACGVMLLLLRNEVGLLEEKEAIAVMENMLNQVGDYFNKINNLLN